MEPWVEKRAARVKLLLMDCDGVLTNGRLQLNEDDEQKWFNVRDGLGIDLLHRGGLRSGIISGRRSTAVERRARELKMSFVRQGHTSKVKSFEEILLEAHLDESEVAFIGDDLVDIPVMLRCELAVAVADAVEETRSVAHYITSAPGGSGAVREVIELILKAQGLWSDLVEGFMK
jgi:3-deoxy-D-manno-octulosonate 8-phosphate phosphatase (KDO 8-P phosphatase)